MHDCCNIENLANAVTLSVAVSCQIAQSSTQACPKHNYTNLLDNDLMFIYPKSVLEAKFALVRQHLHRCRPCTGRWPDQAFGLPLCTGAGLRPAHAPCAGPGLRPAHARCAGPSPGLPMPLRRGRPPARPALGRCPHRACRHSHLPRAMQKMWVDRGGQKMRGAKVR